MSSQHTFIATGNAMNNGVYPEVIIDGSLIIGKEIKPQDICPGTRKNYVIAHDGGIKVTRVKDYDCAKGIIACTSLNPDKRQYPDVNIRQGDCSKIFQVTHFSNSPFKPGIPGVLLRA